MEPFKQLARQLAERDRSVLRDMGHARAVAVRLRTKAQAAIEAFHHEAELAGAAHLRVEIGPVEPDAKDIRAFQFVVERGRTAGCVVALPDGRVRLVGPFRRGGDEGPCLLAAGDDPALETQLDGWLLRVIEEGLVTRPPKS